MWLPFPFPPPNPRSSFSSYPYALSLPEICHSFFLRPFPSSSSHPISILFLHSPIPPFTWPSVSTWPIYPIFDSKAVRLSLPYTSSRRTSSLLWVIIRRLPAWENRRQVPSRQQVSFPLHFGHVRLPFQSPFWLTLACLDSSQTFLSEVSI